MNIVEPRFQPRPAAAVHSVSPVVPSSATTPVELTTNTRPRMISASDAAITVWFDHRTAPVRESHARSMSPTVRTRPGTLPSSRARWKRLPPTVTVRRRVAVRRDERGADLDRRGGLERDPAHPVARPAPAVQAGAEPFGKVAHEVPVRREKSHGPSERGVREQVARPGQRHRRQVLRGGGVVGDGVRPRPALLPGEGVEAGHRHPVGRGVRDRDQVVRQHGDGLAGVHRPLRQHAAVRRGQHDHLVRSCRQPVATLTGLHDDRGGRRPGRPPSLPSRGRRCGRRRPRTRHCRPRSGCPAWAPVP